MKKRRELDALIGNRAKREIQTGEIQADYDSFNSSLSSPSPEAFMPPNHYMTTRRVTRTPSPVCGCTLRRLIRICLPICFLSLVAACIMSCIGIVWMQVQLKTDVDRLKDQVNKLENWQINQPSTIDEMKIAMAKISRDLNMVQDSEIGVKQLAQKLAILTERFDSQIEVPAKRIEQLNSKLEAFKAKIKNLESDISDVKSKSEEIKTSEELLSESYNKLNAAINKVKYDISTQNAKQLQDMASSNEAIVVRISKLNITMQHVARNVSTLYQKIESVKKNTEDRLKGVEKRVESMKRKSEVIPTTIKPSMVESTKRFMLKTSKPRDTNNTISKVENPKPPTNALQDVITKLKSSFDRFDTDEDQSLSIDELIKNFDKSTASLLLQYYDSDHDNHISKNEIESTVLNTNSMENGRAGEHMVAR